MPIISLKTYPNMSPIRQDSKASISVSIALDGFGCKFIYFLFLLFFNVGFSDCLRSGTTNICASEALNLNIKIKSQTIKRTSDYFILIHVLCI